MTCCHQSGGRAYVKDLPVDTESGKKKVYVSLGINGKGGDAKPNADEDGASGGGVQGEAAAHNGQDGWSSRVGVEDPDAPDGESFLVEGVKFRALADVGGGKGGGGGHNASHSNNAAGGDGTVKGGNGGVGAVMGNSSAGQDSKTVANQSNNGGGGGGGGGGYTLSGNFLASPGGRGGEYKGGITGEAGGPGASVVEYNPVGGGGGAGAMPNRNHEAGGGHGGDPGGGGGGGGWSYSTQIAFPPLTSWSTHGGNGGVGRAWIRAMKEGES